MSDGYHLAVLHSKCEFERDPTDTWGLHFVQGQILRMRTYFKRQKSNGCQKVAFRFEMMRSLTITARFYYS